MTATPLIAVWAMLLIACVALASVSVGALAIAIASPAGTLAHLDAWRGVAESCVALVASAIALAALTLVSVHRGETLDDDERIADAVAREVVVERQTTHA